MAKIVLYFSAQLKKIPQTGGIRRFKELLNGQYEGVERVLMSGDEDYPVQDCVRHVSMHHTQMANKESKYARWNVPYLKQMKREGYDWIISFDVPPALWLALRRMPHLCLMVRKDLIGYEKVMLEDAHANALKGWVKLTLLNLAEAITLMRSEKIIVQCEYDREQLCMRHPILRKGIQAKTLVQINNVNPSWVQKSEQKVEGGDGFVIGSISDFSNSRKGCDIFLGAVAGLIDEGYEMIAYIAGDGKYLPEYQEKYKNYPQIHFCGRIKDPSGFMQPCSLMVVPSRADSCPNTVMEALYNGVPVIASNVGGIPEILGDREALFEPEIGSLKNKIIQYFDAENRKKLLEQQGRRTMELSFDWGGTIYAMIVGDGKHDNKV